MNFLRQIVHSLHQAVKLSLCRAHQGQHPDLHSRVGRGAAEKIVFRPRSTVLDRTVQWSTRENSQTCSTQRACHLTGREACSMMMSML